MIQLHQVSLAHGDVVLFDAVSFGVQPGERCGLVGRNGSGKTSLLKILAGQETPDKGKILVPKGYRFGYLDQHIEFAAKTVLDEALLGLAAEESDCTYRAEKVLFGLGFTDEMVRSPIEKLSGGYHLRLRLAKVLLSEPDCLLLDEPTNYLDILSMRFLARLLQKWTGECILVSHDREFMDSVSSHTIGIHRGHVQKVHGTTEDLFDLILRQEEMYEKTRLNLEAKRDHMQTFVDRLGAKATKARQAQSRKKMIEKMPALEELQKLDQLDFRFCEAPFHGKKVGEANDVAFRYSPSDPLLIKNFSLHIGPGDRIAIIGRNGLGKSTLLRLLAQELTPSTELGQIVYAEQVRIGYFGQTNIQRLNPRATIEEEISLSNPNLSFLEVKRICAQMMFRGPQSEKRISCLSGGEKSRVLLGKILAKPCNLLLLDEPTHHLDIESVEALIDALESFHGSIVLVTHSEFILERLRPQVLVVCHAGEQQVFFGGYEEFLENVGWPEETAEPTEKPRGGAREERRLRAERVHARAKILQPLKKELDRLEQSIMALEEEQRKDQLLLSEMAHNGGAVQPLLMAIGKREKIIEETFSALMKLGEEYEEKKRQWPL